MADHTCTGAVRCDRFSLEGCQKVAGGRSAAQTTGEEMEMTSDPGRVAEIVAPLRSADVSSLVSGGLRCATTNGYYLSRLRRGDPR